MNASSLFSGSSATQTIPCEPRLVEGPVVAGHHIQHSDAQHLLIIDESVVPCTPTEYTLLIPLLHHAGTGLSFAQLLGEAESKRISHHTRRLLTQHMSRLRAKLWPFALDILCLTGYGYLVQAVPQEQRAEDEAPLLPAS